MIQSLATILDDAARNAIAVDQLTKQHQITEQQAYAIQAASIERRYARGEKFIGLKMGFTSRAKMEQMGVHDMIWGRLTDQMLYENEGQLPMKRFIHPRAEPEICFLVKKAIDHELTLEEASAHIESLAAALEIIDSRYQNFKFSLEDVIADNCSSSGLVVGSWQSVDTDLSRLRIDLVVNGETVQTGSSSDILGNPWESLVNCSRLAVKYQQPIPAGSYIMAGAATPAVYLKSGQAVKAVVEQIGEVSLQVI